MRLCMDCKWCGEIDITRAGDFTRCERPRYHKSKTNGKIIEIATDLKYCEIQRSYIWPFECGFFGMRWKSKD